MRGIRISSRYAKSLLDLCLEKGQLDVAYADMQLVHKAIKESREFEVVLQSPVIKTYKKITILEEIFRDKISPITFGFINLLAQKGREGLLAEVAESFLRQTKVFKKITEVELVSSVKLDDATRKKLLEAAVLLSGGGEVDMVERFDEELIGGFILRVADKQIDTSVSGLINQLRREFAENPYVAEI